MNPESLEKARTLFESIERGLTRKSKATVIICPSFIHITPLASLPKRKVLVGAQDVSFETKGAFTGGVSAAMLRDSGVTHVIVGHSERRAQGETDEMVNKKALAVLKEGLTPIICIGEAVRDDDGHYLAFIKNQLETALVGVSKKELSSIIIAYEPVWAIGATEAMVPRTIHEMTIFIRKTIVDHYKLKMVVSVPILYGGSVDPINTRGILTEGDVDGLLVGRQSLETQSFLSIIISI